MLLVCNLLGTEAICGVIEPNYTYMCHTVTDGSENFMCLSNSLIVCTIGKWRGASATVVTNSSLTASCFVVATTNYVE